MADYLIINYYLLVITKKHCVLIFKSKMKSLFLRDYIKN